MKIGYTLAFLLLCASASGQPTGAFVERFGYVMVEAESQLSGPNEWKFGNSEENDLDGFTGDGYIRMEGGSAIGGPSQRSVISYKIKINNPGTYTLAMRSWKDPPSGRGDQHNDCWIKLVDAPGFEGQFTKTFMAGALRQWNWNTQQETPGHTFRDPLYTFGSPGEYEVQISGRSRGYHLDKFVFYDATKLSTNMAERLPSSLRDDFPIGVVPDNYLETESQIEGVVARICSGCEVDAADSTGEIWEADFGFEGGRMFVSPNSISGVPEADVPLYRTERTGPRFSYEIAVPSVGVYRATLALAEIFFNDPGQRLFSVAVEGYVPESFFLIDVVDRVGAFTATQTSVLVDVADGVLNIDFSTVLDNAKVSGIVIEGPILPSGTDPAPSLSSVAPTAEPTAAPIAAAIPTATPVVAPTAAPIAAAISTATPVVAPTAAPVVAPTDLPVPSMTMIPVVSPTGAPSVPSATPFPTPAAGVAGFKLIYAPTNAVVMDLVDGSIVDLNSIGLPADFNVQAVSVGSAVQSVRFVENQRGESVQPFAYCGDNGGDYFTCPAFAADIGDITVSVVPFAGPFQSGGALPVVSVTFSIVGGLPL